jgi:hypothetical protein
MLEAMKAAPEKQSALARLSADDQQTSLFRRMPAGAKLRLVGQYIRFAKVLQDAKTSQTLNGPHAITRNPG